MDGQFKPDYGTNMLPEVTLVGKKKNKKAFGDTYVGGLITDLVQGYINNNQNQVGTSSKGTPIATIQPMPSITITPAPTIQKKDNTMLIVGGVVGVGILGFGIYALSKKSKSTSTKKPLNGVRGSKKKRTPKKHEIINL